MSELPRGWVATKLGEIATPRGERVPPAAHHDKQFVGLEHVESQTTRILGSVPAAEVKSSASLFRAGDVLYGRLRPYLNKVAKPDFDGLASAEFIVFPDQVHLRSGFLKHRLNAGDFASFATHLNAGDRPRVDFEQIGAFGIALPPAAEQQRIVEKLEELLSDLDAGTTALERARANLKRYRAAVLKAAVEGRLTEKWRAEHPDTEPARKLLERILAERRKMWEVVQLKKYAERKQAPPHGWKDKYVEPAKPNVASLPGLPRSWLWSSLGQCFPVVVGSTPSRGDSRYWRGDINWVSSGEVQFNRISETKEKITAEGLANSSTRINPKGSVLLGMIGEGKTRGQAAILDIPAANNQNCAAIWVSETEVLPEFVYFWLWSRYEITRSGGSGNNQPALNKSLVEMIPFPLPPVEEQREIVLEVDKYCSNLEHSLATLEVMGGRSSRLRQAILKRAFEGKLVPQDPKDEPASEVLKRIRVAREAEAGKRVGVKRREARSV